jgi:DNA invertase Pin-like site-specific DNA recombinase
MIKHKRGIHERAARFHYCPFHGIGRLGEFAEFERAMIQERVQAGLARARSEGKKLGREERIRAALDKPGRTEGVRKIAARFGVNPGTVQRISSSPFEVDAASTA